MYEEYKNEKKFFNIRGINISDFLVLVPIFKSDNNDTDIYKTRKDYITNEIVERDSQYYLEKLGLLENNNMESLSEIKNKPEYSFSLEKYAEIVKEVSLDYPDLSVLSEDDVEMIYSDFPNITSLNKIYQNYEQISDIYESQIRHEVYLKLINDANNIKTLSSKGTYDNLTTAEKRFAIRNPKATYEINKAKNKAEKATQEVVREKGLAAYKGKADAFRHSYWMALSAYNIAEYKKDIQKGVNLALEFGRAHESENKSSTLDDQLDNFMDLHNNEFGANYFASHAEIKTTKKFFVKWKYLSSKSHSELETDLINSAAKAKRIFSIPADKPDTLVHLLREDVAK